ncbi:hypothetical protein H0H93_004183 [Arthromyces matolae]|nr:hypothetical protein H0H93_004183 [Arthromyces matolae]
MHSPALDVLWFRQTSLLNLLKCFPEPVFTKVEGREAKFAFQSLPEVKDYDRVRFYASRIREFKWIDKSERSVNPVVHSTLLSQCSIVGPLLPKLQSLTIVINDFHKQAIYARLVMSPNLRSICILAGCYDQYGYSLKDEDIPNIIAVLGPCLPFLCKFQLRDVDDENIFTYRRLHTGISLLCRSFRQMEILQIRDINVTQEALTHLASLTALTHLEFSISSDDLSLFASVEPTSDEAFHSIRTLRIHTDKPDGCAHFLSSYSLPHLSDVCIVQWDDGVDWALDTLFKNIPGSCLESLKLWKFRLPPWNDFGQDIDVPPPIPFTPTMLNSVLRNKNLTCLDITFELSVELDDVDLKALSVACPRLKYLSLPDDRLQTEAALTFHGLLAFVQNCKDLETLIIRVNANVIPEVSLTSHFEPSYTLKHLGVCTSPLKSGNTCNVAQTIAFLFPKLEELNVSETYTNGTIHLPYVEICHLKAWKEVIDSLRPLVKSANRFPLHWQL